ncbi:MAG: hypothetical protein JWQ57_565 [Mucilaginibacter sp.]|nr:hypothetical protein [Mucilaginibacter sp.]
MKKIGGLKLLMIILLIQGCKTDETGKTITDKGLTISMSAVKDAAGDNKGLAFKAMLVPSATLIADSGKALNLAMTFKNDSAFFIEKNGEKIFAAMVQPVANGIKGSFEYLILFNPVQQTDTLSVVYQDKFLNKKRYTFKFFNN